MKTRQAAEEFLASTRIAVTGVSRTPGSHGGNVVYTRLRERGWQVVAINPNTDTVEGDPCYPDLRSVPEPVEAVVVATAPRHAAATVAEALELGVRKIWLHRSIDAGSVDAEAVRLGREGGATVIDGGCPLMYGTASDGGHRVMCRLFSLVGRVPRTV